jgi:hypothetical protein
MRVTSREADRFIFVISLLFALFLRLSIPSLSGKEWIAEIPLLSQSKIE